MKYSDIEYQNDTINNALHSLQKENERFNLQFPNLEENLKFHKNCKKCNQLQLKFMFFCMISFILIFNISMNYKLSLLSVSIPFIILASFWGIIYYIYNHHIVNLPNYLYYLFLINFFIYIILWIYLPFGNNDFIIISERIVIALKIFFCIVLYINYFRFSKQAERKYLFLNILDKLVEEQQVEYKEQNENQENTLINEIQEDKIMDEVQEKKQEEVLNQSPPKEIEQNDNQSSKNKRNSFSVFNDLKNFFASIYSVEEAQQHSFLEFLDAAKERYSEIPFIGIRYSFLYYDGTIKRSDSKNIDKDFIYDPDTIEQYYSKYCNNKLFNDL